ncbi:hypothetical protein HHI36_006361 [Cryptolaemus montrouzieri]|uniref:Uncharacterized protein n=1 Tax=Cryptolaemus montrouzieri TaxID=559131 RepID=A0ABD2NXW6_9CUCU
MEYWVAIIVLNAFIISHLTFRCIYFPSKLWIYPMMNDVFYEQSKDFKFALLSEYILSYTIVCMIFMMNAIYKGKLLYIMTGREYSSTVSSYEDTLKRSMLIGFPSDIPQFAKYRLSHRNIVKCGTSMECLNRTACDKDIAVLLENESSKKMQPLFLD